MMRLLKFVDRLHWLWLLLAAPLLLFPSPRRSVALLVIPFLWLLHLVVVRGERLKGSSEKKDLFPVTPLNGAILLIALMMLVSLWATFSISFSLSKIAGVVLGLGAFIAVIRESQTARGWLFSLLAFFLVGLLIAGAGLLGTAWFTTKITILNAITAHLPHFLPGGLGVDGGIQANETAGGLVWVLPVILAVTIWMFYSIPGSIRRKDDSLKERNPFKASPWRLGLAAGSFALGLLLTGGVFLLAQSRGAYLGLAISLIAMVLIALPPKKRQSGLAVLLVLILAGGIVIATHWEAIRLWATQADSFDAGALSLSTLPRRVDIWSRAVSAISDFPITGMGMGTFRYVLPKLYPLFNVSATDYDIGHAHNEFLQAALDLGLPGLVGFISLYVGAYWMLFKGGAANHVTRMAGAFKPFLGSASISFVKAILFGLGGGLTAHLFYSFTDAVALGAKPAILFWMLLGLICGLFNLTGISSEKPATQ